MSDENSLKIKVLLIEDDLEQCLMIRDYFKLDDVIEVCGIATDGLEGVRKIGVHNPDVVLSDLIMPSVDGLEVVKAVKSGPAADKTKVIVLSALGDGKMVEQAFKLGADYYVMKPVDLPFLAEKISWVCGKESSFNRPDKTTERFRAGELVRSIGVPVNLAGYKYVMDYLEDALGSGGRTSLKEAYCYVAEKNSTSSSCVEVCICNAIKRAYREKNENYVSLFKDYVLDKRPSNSVFLNVLKETLINLL